MAQYHDYGLACGDCVQAIANDDYSGLDYSYDAEESEKRMAEIKAGINACPGYLVVGDEYGFSWRGCDVCGSSLGGDKHEVGYLTDEEE